MTKKSKMILNILLFFVVVIPFLLVIKKLWFGQDDLGNIMNGLIRNWKDFIRVFTDDETKYIMPHNYTRPIRNFINGYTRPMQHIPFSILYFLFGPNPYVFYTTSIIFHGINSVLIFNITRRFLSDTLSIIATLFFAFFPFYEGLLRACSLHHYMSVFFFLLSIHFFLSFMKTDIRAFFYSSGLFLFLSLLSRETAIFAPFAFILGTLLFTSQPQTSLLNKIKFTFSKTWIFIGTLVSYVSLKLYSFGITTLTQTLGRFLFKVPTAQIPSTITPLLEKVVTHTQATPSEVAQQYSISLWTKIAPIYSKVSCLFFKWAGTILQLESKLYILGTTTILLFSLVYGLRKRFALLLFLIFSTLCFMWPSIVVAVDSRYMDLAYPLMIFAICLAIHFLLKEKTLFSRILVICATVIGFFLLANGLWQNMSHLRKTGIEQWNLKKTYQKLVSSGVFKKKNHAIFLNMGLETDLESQFQILTGNKNLNVSRIYLSILSNKTSGGGSKVAPIKDGFRLTSLDENKCSWSLHKSQPVRWNEEQRAFLRHPHPFPPHQWHEFSMGKFYIHKMNARNEAIDISYKFDKKWLTQETVFIGWNTEQGRYEALDSQHIFK
jgi:hypothetical protein